MAFMQQQITRKMDWFEIEANGTYFVAVEDAPELSAILDDHHAWDKDEDAQNDILCDAASQYAEGEVTGVTIRSRSGYGAQMSAPGYMDCTEWCVFDTVEEAESYLAEMYGDDENDDSDDE